MQTCVFNDKNILLLNSKFFKLRTKLYLNPKINNIFDNINFLISLVIREIIEMY